MTETEAHHILFDLIYKLPWKCQRAYILCDGTDDICAKVADYFGSSPSIVKQYYESLIGSTKYVDDRKDYRYLYANTKDVPGLRIFGVALNPILINYSEIDSIRQLQFTYLHEVGHLLGRMRKCQREFPETIADKIALKYLRKYCNE